MHYHQTGVCPEHSKQAQQKYSSESIFFKISREILVCRQTLFFLSFSLFFSEVYKSGIAYNDLFSYVP